MIEVGLIRSFARRHGGILGFHWRGPGACLPPQTHRYIADDNASVLYVTRRLMTVS